MFSLNDYDARKLEEHEWKLYKKLRLEALRKHPESYWKTYAEEKDQPDEYFQEMCREIPNKQCAFGLFHDGELVGIVRVIYGQGDPRYDGQAVLSVLYVRDEPDAPAGRATKLIEEATKWTAEQKDYDRLYAAYVIANDDAANSLYPHANFAMDKGPFENPQRVAAWLATGEPATMMWYMYALAQLRPDHKPDARGQTAVGPGPSQ